MWLRNYYNMLTAFFLADDTLTSSTQPTDYDPPIMLHLRTGLWRAANSHSLTYDLSSSTYMSYIRNFVSGNFFGKEMANYGNNPNRGFAIQFGTGTTAATYDDYTIETPITSGLSIVTPYGTLTQATAYDNVTHHISSKHSYTINNTSASPITITEFGIYVDAAEAVGESILIYRDVLATPITLNPSESAIVSFERDAEVYNYTPY